MYATHLSKVLTREWVHFSQDKENGVPYRLCIYFRIGNALEIQAVKLTQAQYCG